MIKETIKICIVDDHQLFAEGLKRIIEDNENYKVVKICNNWKTLKLLLNNQTPHLILLDIQMKGINGIEICALLKESHPNIKIILISMLENSSIIEDGKKANANGFIPKTTDASLVKETVENVLKGIDSFINNQISLEKKPIFLITKREKEIIKLIKSGCNTPTIAEKLAISKYTVDTHRKNILKKLNLNSTKELIGFAYENYF